jgi:hypothetical protein
LLPDVIKAASVGRNNVVGAVEVEILDLVLVWVAVTVFGLAGTWVDLLACELEYIGEAGGNVLRLGF